MARTKYNFLQRFSYLSAVPYSPVPLWAASSLRRWPIEALVAVCLHASEPRREVGEGDSTRRWTRVRNDKYRVGSDVESAYLYRVRDKTRC